MATELEAAGEVAVVEPHPGPGPPFSGATIHQHRAPGTLGRVHISDHCGQNITRTYITSFHLSGQLQLPRLDSAKLIVINSLSSSLF